MVEIVLEGPAKNALSSELMERARAQLAAAGGRPVLLTGAGDAFSAGLNLKELVDLDEAGMSRFLGLLGGLLSDLFHYPGPTVALVNGHAIAGGCLVALACDVRVAVADPRARIGLNEVALGLRFPPGALKLVQHRIGAPWAEHVMLGSALYSPEEAQRVGLIDEVSPEAGSVARSRLEALAALPSVAYSATKRDLRGGVSIVSDDDQVFHEEVLPLWTGPELKQRIRAFLGR